MIVSLIRTVYFLRLKAENTAVTYGQLTRATAVAFNGDYMYFNIIVILLTYCIIELISCLIFRSFSNL